MTEGAPMDWNIVLSQMGWSGLLCGALIYVFKLYTQVQEQRIVAMDKLIEAQNKRIEAYDRRFEKVEERADNCEKDRRYLHRIFTKHFNSSELDDTDA